MNYTKDAFIFLYIMLSTKQMCHDFAKSLRKNVRNEKSTLL